MLAIVAVVGSFARGVHVSAASYGSAAETSTWYCAGAAVLHRANPYRVEPLRSCETAHAAAVVYPQVEPAPLPGYTLAGFALLARLPYAAVRPLWLYALIAALLFTAALLARLTQTSMLLTLLCLSLVDGLLNVTFRELPPIAICALVASAAFGTSKRYTAAALCAAFAMSEPHIGLPGCIAAFLWWPRTRVAFVVAGCAMAVISVMAIGIPANIEYFRDVLPVHAAAEIAAIDQYSLTRVLHIRGFSDATALRVGSVSYLTMTLLGVAVARRLATAVRSEALIVLFPPAVALLGGAFVHDLQLAAAIPAAIILATWARPPLALRFFALVAVVFTWDAASWAHSAQDTLLAVSALVAAGLIALRSERTASRWLGASLGAGLCVTLALALQLIPQRAVGPATRQTHLAYRPTDNASANWAAGVTRDAVYATPNQRDVAEKIPFWLALATLAGIAVFYSRPYANNQRRPHAGAALEDFAA